MNLSDDIIISWRKQSQLKRQGMRFQPLTLDKEKGNLNKGVNQNFDN